MPLEGRCVSRGALILPAFAFRGASGVTGGQWGSVLKLNEQTEEVVVGNRSFQVLMWVCSGIAALRAGFSGEKTACLWGSAVSVGRTWPVAVPWAQGSPAHRAEHACVGSAREAASPCDGHFKSCSRSITGPQDVEIGALVPCPSSIGPAGGSIQRHLKGSLKETFRVLGTCPSVFVSVAVTGPRGTQPGEPLLAMGKFCSFAQLPSRAKFFTALDCDLAVSVGCVLKQITNELQPFLFSGRLMGSTVFRRKHICSTFGIFPLALLFFFFLAEDLKESKSPLLVRRAEVSFDPLDHALQLLALRRLA